mmetsp:Transcript_36117/g.82950  ORF Transcript_36117/g.82950 Transcript_36117/m.82950 type:complete len:344 (-) Transcript_36117:388-1419(-)
MGIAALRVCACVWKATQVLLARISVQVIAVAMASAPTDIASASLDTLARIAPLRFVALAMGIAPFQSGAIAVQVGPARTVRHSWYAQIHLAAATASAQMALVHVRLGGRELLAHFHQRNVGLVLLVAFATEPPGHASVVLSLVSTHQLLTCLRYQAHWVLQRCEGARSLKAPVLSSSLTQPQRIQWHTSQDLLSATNPMDIGMMHLALASARRLGLESIALKSTVPASMRHLAFQIAMHMAFALRVLVSVWLAGAKRRAAQMGPTFAQTRYVQRIAARMASVRRAIVCVNMAGKGRHAASPIACTTAQGTAPATSWCRTHQQSACASKAMPSRIARSCHGRHR